MMKRMKEKTPEEIQDEELVEAAKEELERLNGESETEEQTTQKDQKNDKPVELKKVMIFHGISSFHNH